MDGPRIVEITVGAVVRYDHRLWTIVDRGAGDGYYRIEWLAGAAYNGTKKWAVAGWAMEVLDEMEVLALMSKP